MKVPSRKTSKKGSLFKIIFFTEQRDEMQIKQKAEKQKLKKFRDKVSLDYEFYVKAY